jgi:hypothetical protein
MIDKIRKWYRSLPDKKVYFELLGAVLTIPVLITVILLNLANLNKGKADPTPTPQVIRVVETQTPARIVTVIPAEAGQRISPQASCKKQIGPVNISSPQEGEITSRNPVCTTVSYTAGEYCGIEWAVKIDNGAYSEFDDKDVCFYNLPNGAKTLTVKVRSTEGGEELILQRNFVYGSTATTSAVLTP